MIDQLVARSEHLPPTGGFIEGNSPLSAPLGLHSLLVRESVQNAWDARDDRRGDDPVAFRIDGWDLDGRRLEDLRSLLPVKHLAGFEDGDTATGVVSPAEAISGDSVRVLVVSDRNTVGLCGPTTSGTAWNPVRDGKKIPRGQPRFVNFIRNQGRAKADIGHGDGGAFGIGKSVLWLASRCGTILVHTKSFDADGNPDERFIGVVHGNSFSSGEFDFTGRHFIGLGDPDLPDLVHPLTGAEAATAGALLPIPSYELDGREVMGTSIVIVDPRFDLDWDGEMRQLRDATRWHVWPKRVPGARVPHGGPDMRVELRCNGEEVYLPTPLDDVEIHPYARTLLDCVHDRNVHESGSARDRTIECLRPKKKLGDLKFRTAGTSDDNVFHLTADGPGENSDDGSDPVVPFSAPWGQIALVRREPLLLVRYEPLSGRGTTPSEEATTEVGVFLSADDAQVESALTKAEPPAHDDWIPEQVQSGGGANVSKTFVRMTLKRIGEARSAFLKSLRDTVPGYAGGAEQQFSSRISRGLLAGLAGTGGKPRPKDSKPPGGSGSRKKPSITLSWQESRRHAAGISHELTLAISPKPSDDQPLSLKAGGKARDDFGTIDIAGSDSYRWITGTGTIVEGAEIRTTAAEVPDLSLIIDLSRDVRFRPTVELQLLTGAG